MRKGTARILAVLLVLGAIGGGIGYYWYQKKKKAAAPTPAPAPAPEPSPTPPQPITVAPPLTPRPRGERGLTSGTETGTERPRAQIYPGVYYEPIRAVTSGLYALAPGGRMYPIHIAPVGGQYEVVVPPGPERGAGRIVL